VSERVRCFIAIDIENSSVVEKIVRIQEELSSCGVRLKLVEPENLHITLRFIGEIPKLIVESIKESISNLKFEEFHVTFSGIGAFPQPERPRVIWAGVVEGGDKLFVLSKKVNDLLSKLKLPKEDKEFTPHLTIARVKSFPSSRLSQTIKRLSGVHIGAITVNEVRLKKSTLTPKGPKYSTLLSVKAKT